jgi:mannose-6-phosphate isomerase class I
MHVAQSLASIDFNDFEPKLVPEVYQTSANFKYRHLVQDPLFDIQEMVTESAATIPLAGEYVRVLALIKGSAVVSAAGCDVSAELKPGQFCLVPASLKGVTVKTSPQTTFLCAEPN